MKTSNFFTLKEAKNYKELYFIDKKYWHTFSYTP
jgi:hypothetical protein